MQSKSEQQGNSVAWLLNLVGKFTAKELERTNLKDIGDDYMKKILQYPQLQSGAAFTYNQQKQEFTEQTFHIYPNILICINGNTHTHLILSNCSISKELVQYKESKTYGLIISNNIGNTFLFFSQFVQYRNWYKLMKQYCKLSDFFDKYKLTDRMLPGVYQCYKKSNNVPFTVQIYKMEDFETCPEIEESVHNEIQMLRSVKHQNLLQLRRVYEDQSYLFILYEHFKGESLFNLIGNSAQPLHEVQIASIIFQIFQVLKFLEKHSFYHGNLNPLNIIINSNNQMLQIFLVNLSFKQYKMNEKLDWILNRQIEGFLAPEFYQGVPPNIQSDLYSVGVLLHFMAFPKPLPNEKNFDRYEIEVQLIEKALKKKQQQSLSPLGKSMEDKNSSLSEFDLLQRLLMTQPNKRIQLCECMKHHWFINIKSKIKQMNAKKGKKVELPSLRTIIELRSQSELDLRVQSQLSNRNNRKTFDEDQIPDETHIDMQLGNLDFCRLMRETSMKKSSGSINRLQQD